MNDETNRMQSTQDAIRRVAKQLRRIEGRISEVCANLPEPGDEFEPLAELCGLLRCVNSDLLMDAIKTLELAASQSEAELLREFNRRQQLVPRPRRVYVREMTVSRLWRKDEWVPMLRLTGRWLRGFGFRESSPVEVVVRHGELRIQTSACPKQLTSGERR